MTEEVKKEVKTSKKEVKNESLLDIVFLSIQAGKTIPQISKDLNISKQKLQYYVNKLKNLNQIQKIGYGVWQTSKNTVANSVRLHGLMWHLRLPKEVIIWEEILNKRNVKFTKINKGNTLQIFFKENKIWISKNSIIIYDIKSYFGFNAVDSKKYAMFSLQSFLNELQAKLGINLQNQGNYVVKTSRQHYALVRNALAMQCKKDGTKINVYNERGLWFTIDNSFNLNEAETVHPQTALIDNLGVQKFFNENKETKWEWTPKVIAENFGKISQLLEQTTNRIINLEKENNLLKNQLVLKSPLEDLRGRNYIG